MKKIIVLAIAELMALSASATAFAADTTVTPDVNGDPTPPTADTAITYDVAPTYTVTIPAKE